MTVEQGEPITVATTVTAVTVFTDRAMVVRSGGAVAGPGPCTLLVDHLPGSLDPDSVRARAAGAATTLLEVEVRSTSVASPAWAAVARARAELDARRDALREVEDREAVEQGRQAFLRSLGDNAAAHLARSTAMGRTSYDDLTTMDRYLAAETERSLAAARAVAVERRSAARELEAAEQRLAALSDTAGRSVPSSEHAVAVHLDVGAAGEVAVEVTYQVTGASWQPLYDLRLSGTQLELGYLAEVTQSSGEDWPAVELVLSTGHPGRRSSLPELTPWYIGRPAPPVPLAFAAPPAPGGTAGGPAGSPPAMPSPPYGVPAPAAVPLTAETTTAGVAVAYRVRRALSVPSDGSPHKLTVAVATLEAALDHVTAPRLGPEVHLRATITNTSDLLLLPGPARVFHDAELVASTALELVAPGEEIELYLGTDDRVRVERKLVRRSTSKALLGGTRSVEIGYETTLQAHGDRPVTVSLHDQLPHSRDADIKVRLKETSPRPHNLDELGELTWEVHLEPGAEAVVRFSFAVEHPASVRLPL
jgi:uncharacterized protein (TIGR02231 family)